MLGAELVGYAHFVYRGCALSYFYQDRIDHVVYHYFFSHCAQRLYVGGAGRQSCLSDPAVLHFLPYALCAYQERDKTVRRHGTEGDPLQKEKKATTKCTMKNAPKFYTSFGAFSDVCINRLSMPMNFYAIFLPDLLIPEWQGHAPHAILLYYVRNRFCV